MRNYKFTYIDLFSGIGGFRYALDALKGKCIGFSEINKDAIEVYTDNFNEDQGKNLGDITQIKNILKVDFLTAGVPCQSWSIAGKNLGFDDDRGQLWNDTIYLLHKSKPRAFIFENVKGLKDPRNKDALNFILDRIKQAGYFANVYLLNSFDYGVPQNRLRIYIIGFKKKEHFLKFKLPDPINNKVMLADILEKNTDIIQENIQRHTDLLGDPIITRNFSLSQTNGLNDYFLFNDIRDGHSTIHSWDITKTSDEQKKICLLLLKNRRKKYYGPLDGNPLSLKHFKELDQSITEEKLDELVALGIFTKVEHIYKFKNKISKAKLTSEQLAVIGEAQDGLLNVDRLKANKYFKINRISVANIIESLVNLELIHSIENRYDFKNGKISSGLFGVNRIFLPRSKIFPTLVASDSNDYIALKNIITKPQHYKESFIQEIFLPNHYRKLTMQECCLVQGFPSNFRLPVTRARWMKLIGNSVSIPVISILSKSIIDTGVFDQDLNS